MFVLLSFPARKSGEGIVFNLLSNGSKSGVAKSGSRWKQGFSWYDSALRGALMLQTEPPLVSPHSRRWFRLGLLGAPIPFYDKFESLVHNGLTIRCRFKSNDLRKILIIT